MLTLHAANVEPRTEWVPFVFGRYPAAMGRRKGGIGRHAGRKGASDHKAGAQSERNALYMETLVESLAVDLAAEARLGLMSPNPQRSAAVHATTPREEAPAAEGGVRYFQNLRDSSAEDSVRAVTMSRLSV